MNFIINVDERLQLALQHRSLQSSLPIKDIALQRADIDMSGTQLLNSLAPQQPHGSLSLGFENLKHPLHTRLATGSQSEKRRPTQPNTLGSQSQSLHYICTTLNTPINPDLKFGQDFGAEFADLEESVQSWWGGIQSAAAVVREDDSFDVLGVVRGEVRVFVCLQSLQDDRKGRVFC